MLNNEQKERFAAWLDAEEAIAPILKEIVATAETVDDFDRACREIGERREEQMGDVPVTIMTDTQRQKGEQRRDLYIADFGDVRAVVAM